MPNQNLLNQLRGVHDNNTPNTNSQLSDSQLQSIREEYSSNRQPSEYGYQGAPSDKATEMSDVVPQKTTSIGSPVVEAGVPTNSGLATQHSSTGDVVDKYTIVAVHYEGSVISEVQLNDGSIISADEAIKLVESNKIGGVNTGATRGTDPHKTLRSMPDGDPSNNLSNLPRF